MLSHYLHLYFAPCKILKPLKGTNLKTGLKNHEFVNSGGKIAACNCESKFMGKDRPSSSSHFFPYPSRNQGFGKCRMDLEKAGWHFSFLGGGAWVEGGDLMREASVSALTELQHMFVICSCQLLRVAPY